MLNAIPSFRSLSVATENELGEISGADLVDGDLAFVQATGEYWTLRKSSSATVAAGVAACASGGRWLDVGTLITPRTSILNYGVVGDAQLVTDGAIADTTTALTSATGNFAAGDVGKLIRVAGAGVAGADLFATIDFFVSATEVTLDTAASTTVTGANVVWGTDDGPAIQSALDAWDGTGESVIFSAGNYLIATPIVVPSKTTIRGTDETFLWAHLQAGPDQSQSVFYAVLPSPIGSGTISTTPGRTNQVVVGGWAGTSPAIGQVVAFLNGNSLYTYDIVDVSGVGPYTITLDRAIAVPFVATNTVYTYDSQPNNIRIHGGGMRFRGPCDRFIELGAVNGGLIEDCHVDTVGGGGPGLGDGAISFDTGSRNVDIRRCTTDLTGIAIAVFGIALESVDGGSMRDCRCKGGNDGFYMPDCNAATIDGCYASTMGRDTGSGSGFNVGASATGLGSYDCFVKSSVATDCYFGLSVSAAVMDVEGFAARGCAAGVNVIGSASQVRFINLDTSYCTQIGTIAANATVDGLTALALPSAPAAGLLAVTGGAVRLNKIRIVSTATTFIAAAIKVTGGTLEVEGGSITLADAANAYGIYATAGTVRVSGLTVGGAVTGGVRLDAGLSGFIGPGCDFSAAALPVFSSDGLGWKLLPTGVEQSISMADSDKLATYAQTYSDILAATGAIGADRTLTMAFKSRGHIWTINNQTAGGHNVIVSFGSGTTVTCGAGITRVYWDGTNAVQA